MHHHFKSEQNLASLVNISVGGGSCTDNENHRDLKRELQQKMESKIEQMRADSKSPPIPQVSIEILGLDHLNLQNRLIQSALDL